MKKISRAARLFAAGIAVVSVAMSPLAVAQTGGFDTSEAATLSMIREEERMARDLYQEFSDMYGEARPFSNIVNSEQRHFDVMGYYIDRYGIEDPSDGLPAGTYAHPEIQKLYDDWLDQGSRSLKEAFKVGVELEEQDIADLDAAIEGTDQADLQSAYGNLRAGSENHLVAYERAVLRAEGGGRNGGGRGGPWWRN